MFRPASLLVPALLAFGLLAPVRAATAQTGSVGGTVSTQGGLVPLDGAQVEAHAPGVDAVVASTVSDGAGRYDLSGLPGGRYVLRASRGGFVDLASTPVEIPEGGHVEFDLDLHLLPLSEAVEVGGAVEPVDTSRSHDTVSGELQAYLPVVGEGYRSLLPVVPGVVRAPNGAITVKGARESQGAFQVGRAYANDPSTGSFGIELPADAVESVDVLDNPYGADSGRFSSAVVTVETRQGDNQWRAVANGFVPLPCLKLCDGESLGVRSFRPRGWFGGPIVRDRLFIGQGLQYRYARVRVPGLPEDGRDTRDVSLEAFTRLDASLRAWLRLTSTLAVFRRTSDRNGLGPFVEASATPRLKQTGWSATTTGTATLTPTTALTSSLTVSAYRTTVSPYGPDPLELTIDGRSGHFFNRQSRRTHAVQWTGTVTHARDTTTGAHVLQVGADVIRAGYDGTSASAPIVVRRADGTVSQRYTFGGATRQDEAATDVAVFAQDRWRLDERLLVEPGVRVERDGVTGRVNVAPRFGFVLGLLPDGAGVLRGGAGRFFERTPLNVGAFESFEPATETWYAADGLTPLAPARTRVHQTGSLRTPQARIWNLEYDQRLGPHVLLKVSHLRRASHDLAIVEPVERAEQAVLALESRGRAAYTETELTVRIGADDRRHLAVTYVRSRSRTHLNAYDQAFGNFRAPVVRPDAYTLAPTDAPHRLLVRGLLPVRQVWTLSSLVEVRSGFPFSRIDEDQRYVGVRNQGGRFPTFTAVDLSLVRQGTILGRQVQFGVRAYHVLHQFMPRDVQLNVDAPDFGTFSNPMPRRIVVTVRFSPQ